MQYLEQKRGIRQQELLQLVNKPFARGKQFDKNYHNSIENARQFLKANVEEILDLEPCPRFVAVSGNKIFYGELDNEVSYRWVTEGTTPGFILDLDPDFVNSRF